MATPAPGGGYDGRNHVAVPDAAQGEAIVNEPDLWMLSLNAFAAVVVLLSALAVVLSALVRLFPARETAPADGTSSAAAVGGTTTDAATVAAIHTAVERVAPGARVMEVREVGTGAAR